MTSSVLTGLRVVDMTEVWAGPMGSSFLGDLGADVVKIESFPRRSAVTRTTPPVAGGDPSDPPWERIAIHHISNRNKRNLALNIRTEQGAGILRQLIGRADVMVEGYSAGTIEKLGFGWEAVRQLNGQLIMLSMPGWGVEGPYQGYVTLGSGLDATIGHAAVRGYPDRPLEQIPPIFHSDATGAITLVSAVMSGLFQREATRSGVFIDLSQAEALAWQLPGLLAEYTLNGRLPARLGNRDRYVVPHGCYRAGGGAASDATVMHAEGSREASWVVIEARTDHEWGGVARAAGHPEWAAAGHPWATVVGRMRAREAIDLELADYAAGDTAENIARAVVERGGVASPVNHHSALVSSPQLTERGWLQPVEHRYMGLQLMHGLPWSIEPDASLIERATALLGEHNREVLTELGLSEDEISSLEAEGVIGDSYPAG